MKFFQKQLKGKTELKLCKNLEKAIKQYNEKAQKIMESSDMKKLQDSYQKHAKDAQSNLIKAQKEFIKISDEINNKKWSNEKKEKKIKELYDYILNKLYTKEDMEKCWEETDLWKRQEGDDDKMLTGANVIKWINSPFCRDITTWKTPKKIINLEHFM